MRPHTRPRCRNATSTDKVLTYSYRCVGATCAGERVTCSAVYVASL